ncbi:MULTISPECIES: glycosyltransferase family 4 protein [unclassified Shewanella]|uniref:glycosyltransferase family 4 protein n=1 Tax=unclassified Shewanella TaxID=196818 RepID=UPI001BBD868B|nr:MULTISPECIES: glycosyltransferase family 4 protein [unclassified Shewanella]GIU18060.1 glycosyltransferase WbuB [Shewanella sp. MBTL60-112-B1]GIU38901.1 glycosyltransferase WbuB [Shewanella sp. MBTL60-112-B2]
MHLALVIDDYLPHSTRVAAKMFHELAVELQSMGCVVTVITPHFYEKNDFIEEVYDGIKVWRFSSGPIKDIGKVKRAINETLLSSRAWKSIKHKVEAKTFDGVIYYSPSIFFGGVVANLKQRCSCPAYLVLRDFFPQWIIDAGMIKEGSLIERYFRYFERHSYNQADMIGIMSEKNMALFNKSTKSRYQAQILRNWAALIPYELSNKHNSIRRKLNIQDKVIFFYGGNIGHAQDMANLMRLAKSMLPYIDAHFLFVGQGDEVELINNLVTEWSLTNVSYLPSVNQSEFKDILADIDVGLFSLSAKHTAHNFPGKLLGYMVQSLPILGSVNEGNDLQELVNEHGAGLITVNGEDEQFLKNAISLFQNAIYRKTVGQKAYTLLEHEFSVNSIATNILDKLKGNHESSGKRIAR